MTLEFDKKARKKEKYQKRLIGLIDNRGNEKPNQMRIKKIDTAFARQFISTYHYSKILPDSTKECFAGYYNDKLAGIITFGMGANNQAFKSLIPNIEMDNVRELTRLWSPDGMPKNTESKLIMDSIKKLPDNVYLILSFADPSHNHIGVIYQATNFFYCGMSNGSKMLTDGKEVFHIRTIGSYKRRHPELIGLTNKEIMNKYGWKTIDSVGKHRYVLLKGKKWIKDLMYKEIKDKIQEYPKLKYKGCEKEK